ncbi:MAG TPA: TonB-dependent receptor [Steroidobacteraceae bacterium]|nr:TonB-dependent receptor [Steroidobacteraceae bacterium]
MKPNPKLSRTIAAILSGAALGVGTAHADTPAAPEASEADTIQTVTVTAQRRSESIQDVPITIQAMTGAQLNQMSITTFDQVLKYLPNVTFGGSGPGMGNIFMRGMSSGFAGNQSSATFASFPNVATYLDEQSLQFPSRNLDVYMVDMERVEVLEGPQGTLFGGGAEAGAIRYITNKPKLDRTEGNAEASYGVTAGGDPNKSINATLNVPLIPNVLAVRAVIYDDRRGGYIDNVPSSFTRSNNDSGNYYGGVKPGANGLCPNGQPTNSGFCVPATNVVANNFAIARSASNPVEYGGLRVSALWQITDDWSALVTQSYQDMEADGLFVQYPKGSDGQTLGPWQVTAFVPAVNKDRYENTALTISGKIGDLRAVYSGGYLVRHVDQTNDYSNYTRSAYGFYYTCSGGSGFGSGTPSSLVPTCYTPITSWRDIVTNTHLSNEVRLSTPDDWRARGIVGAYEENFEIADNMNFYYKTIPSCTPLNLANALAGGLPCVGNVGPPPGTTATDPTIRNDNTAFGEDVHRGYHQDAAFGSIDFDLIPKVLTLTGGTRWYHYSEFEVGSKYVTPLACADVANTPGCFAGATSINAENEHATYSGFKSRGNLTWHITPDMMVYYTFSQGFRPGGFNRTIANKAKDANGVPQYSSPLSYKPDSLTNNEIGLKAEFLDHRLQLNLSGYRMDWKDVQFTLFQPTILGNTTFVVNGPNYRITGFEAQFVALVAEGLTVQGSGSWNNSTQTSSPCLVDNFTGSPNIGNCITEVKGASFPNPFGLQGSRPAFSPAVEFNLQARYEWTMSDYRAFATVGASHIGDMSNQPASFVDGNTVAIPYTTWLRYDMPGYTTYDASIGVSKDNWTATFYGQNLSNSDASTFTTSAQFIKAEVPLRPRVLGLKIGYKF